jgi:hypothetical protein
MVRKPEGKSFLAKRAWKKETQPKGWVFLLKEKSKLRHSEIAMTLIF